jgi:hypothetical protein
MKMINCNDWAPRNNLNTLVPIPIPITNLPVDLRRLLIKLYFAYSPGRLFYYRLVELVIYSFLNREDDYFNENN